MALPASGEETINGANRSLLRIGPLIFWIVGREALALSPDEGAVLDISHSRTHIRISGPQLADLSYLCGKYCWRGAVTGS